MKEGERLEAMRNEIDKLLEEAVDKELEFRRKQEEIAAEREARSNEAFIKMQEFMEYMENNLFRPSKEDKRLYFQIERHPPTLRFISKTPIEKREWACKYDARLDRYQGASGTTYAIFERAVKEIIEVYLTEVSMDALDEKSKKLP